MTLKIGALAQLTRTNTPTIRYYEEIGLLPPASRRAGGQRCYDEQDVKRVTFIRRCREFAIPIKHVQILVSLMQDGGRSCGEVRDLARQHLEAVREKLVELKALEHAMEGSLQRCDDRGSSCVALQDLTRPADL